ncbi:hypothetical protein EYS14_05045 [Alteromonadaceae bacterium M269]|nr:hypothetical protein EYS14_05045 [Alteromonadaceae bacterium M269]
MNKTSFSIAWLAVLLFILSGCSSYKYLLPKGPEITVPQEIPTGYNAFVMNAYKHSERKTIRVWTYKPSKWEEHNKVLFVMHGMGRNAKDYLDAWVDIAENKNLLLIAPEFHNKFYRYTTNDYQDGNLLDFFGSENPKEEWAFQVIDNILEHINNTNPFTVNTYNIFGHSAGSQFVHRLVLLYPTDKIDIAIAANAGVYTFPDKTGKYPYYLPEDHQPLAQSFSKNLIILLGEKDNNNQGGVLNESKHAMIQGENRLERGNNFYKVGKNIADKQNLIFNWQLHQVPNVGHNKDLMIKAASEFL